MNMRYCFPLILGVSTCAGISGCASLGPKEAPVVPAEEFTAAYHRGTMREYSFHKRARMTPAAAPAAPAAAAAGGLTPASFGGDPRFLNQGYTLKASAYAPSPQFISDGGAASRASMMSPGQPPYPPHAALPAPPPGSSSPYYQGQMTSNPSLWPDESQGAFLFTDHRALRPLDVVTIVIDENNKGKKKADTDSKVDFSLTAGIAEFFGIETKKWVSNNESLDPAELINANTNYQHKAEGETEREGTLRGRISAVVMEVLPNGLLRIEGTKIVSLNAEEEILVISGLVRTRDVSSNNQVESGRIAFR